MPRNFNFTLFSQEGHLTTQQTNIWSQTGEFIKWIKSKLSAWLAFIVVKVLFILPNCMCFYLFWVFFHFEQTIGRYNVKKNFLVQLLNVCFVICICMFIAYIYIFLFVRLLKIFYGIWLCLLLKPIY